MAAIWDQPTLNAFRPTAPYSGAREISSCKNGRLSPNGIFRERLPHGSHFALAVLMMVLSAVSTRAQDNYEIQVYGYELVGSLGPYQAEHRKLARRPAAMSWLMLTLDGRDLFRQRVMQAFATEPRTFARMLALHVGASRPLALAGIGVSLGWDLLTL